MNNAKSLIIIVFFLIIGCAKKETNKPEKSEIYFNSLSGKNTGIDFSNDLFFQNDLNIIEYLYYYNGGGVAVGDINNDGLEDIYLGANQSEDKLYLNLGNLKFKDITKNAGLKIDSTWSTGVSMADVNNDGFLDIYVCKVGNYKSLKSHNLLYINQKDNTFKEMSKDYGLDFSGFSTQGSFFDYDKDNDLDFYLMNHSIHTPRSYGSIAYRNQVDSLAGDRFFENKLDAGENSFVDITKDVGIFSSSLGYGLALAVSDINDDGWMDVYVGNDFHENDYLYINQEGKGFKESSKNYFGHTSRFTMGLDIADLNNDTRLDIFSLDMMPFNKEIFMKSGGEDSDKVAQIKSNYGFENQYARNVMQLNRDNSSFSDIALMTNTYASDWSWSSLIQDYDNDGLNDIFITNGIYKRPNDLNYINLIGNSNMAKYSQSKQNLIEKKLIEEMPTINIPNVIYKNNGDFDFEMLTETAGMQPTYSNGAAYSDFDNDGDIDIITNNINQEAKLLENISSLEKENNYISFSLKGDSILNSTLGSKIKLFFDKKAQLREMVTVRGFQSSSSPKLHFGLGQNEKIDSVQIKWPDNQIQTLKNLSINQHYIITRTDAKQSKEVPNNLSFSEILDFPYAHIENNYIDYEREILMPEKLSTEGPAIEVADFNGDSINDIFLGGAKYNTPSYFLGNSDGTFTKQKGVNLYKDAIFEDVDATSLDIDNDGDLDLYVMSGGNEIVEGSDYLEDRLYINDGKGTFVRLPLDMLKTNGGSVSSADFNNDSFPDLFIGSRSISGGYGLSPYSFILLNNGDGQFNISLKERIGMVTDSKCVDLNNDGFLDLVIVGDWMPITIYLNDGTGKFKNTTERFGLNNTNGMWNCVSIADFDNNGQLDIVAGNAGLNIKWKASINRPVKLYLDDFDNNTQLDPIIFYDFFGEYVPFGSKDMLVSQLPKLKKEFLDYDKFSKIKTIEDLVGMNEKDILEIKKITELRSMIYYQENNTFKGHQLPMEAQMSSVEDVFVDQHNSRLIFVGNYLNYVNELGESNANSGGVIKLLENQKLSFSNYLDLPNGLNSRKIEPVGNGKFLVISNNDRSYLLKIK